MKLSGDIRVRTSRRYKSLYNELRNFVVKEMHEIFFLCACLGYRSKKRKPLMREGEDRFWSGTITPEEWACFYAMKIESTDMEFESFPDDREVIKDMEEYANAGMEVLLDEILADYTIERGDELRLDFSCSTELPKVLLHYLYEKANA